MQADGQMRHISWTEMKTNTEILDQWKLKRQMEKDTGTNQVKYF